MSAAPRPDFFIAGAAKCGTTALFRYLSAQPGVFIPTMKEPKFFCSDLKTLGGVYQESEYRGLYAAAPAHFLTGDASAMYLYSKIAVARIIEHNPRARIIVALRYPVDAAHSLHASGWAHQVENISDFEEAWRAQEARMAGERMPPRRPDAATLQYGAIYRYAEQVRRVLQYVPDSQRHFIVFEEFFANPHEHFARLLEFLGLPVGLPTAFPIVNPTCGFRSNALARTLNDPPVWLRRAYAPFRPLFRAAAIQPVRRMQAINTVRGAKASLQPGFRAELARYFAPDIAELEELLGRPLWRDLRK